MFTISPTLSIPLTEIEFAMIRAEGPGGQHVNKTSSAVQLRFDIMASSLPDTVKQRLRAMRDHRITADGVIVIKAQDERSLTRNRETALERLRELIAKALIVLKKRKKTRPPRSAVEKRLGEKKKRSDIKKLRSSIDDR